MLSPALGPIRGGDDVARALAEKRQEAVEIAARRAHLIAQGWAVPTPGGVDRPSATEIEVTVHPLGTRIDDGRIIKRPAEIPDAFDGEDLEVKKAMRAERNRQSAAASRERKKTHMTELERRVKELSKENAKLQLGQLTVICQRVSQELELLEENYELKKKVAFRDLEIDKLSSDLKELKTDQEHEHDTTILPRPKTWDAGDWGRKKVKEQEKAQALRLLRG